MINVFFQREARMVEVAEGSNVLDAARKAGVEVHRGVAPGHLCHASSVCDTCAVTVKQGVAALSPRTPLEHALTGAERLACQVRLYDSAIVVTGGEEIRFLPDTAAPTWGIFSGGESGVLPTTVPGLLRA